MDFKVNLKIIMAKRKVNSITELSKLTGVSVKPLYSLSRENNIGSVKLDTLKKICDTLDCSLNELIEYPTKDE